MTTRLRLRELLEARGMTFHDLDGVSYNVLLGLDAGTVKAPRHQDIFLIATRLRVQPGELLEADDHSSSAEAIRKLRIRYED